MTDGEGATSYVYNGYRQLQSETRLFTALVGKQYTLNYAYNLADQLKSVNYAVNSGGIMGPMGGPMSGPMGGGSTVSISGTVTTAQGAGISGVTITVTGGFGGGSAVTDTNGNYTVSGLAAGWTYTVTPSKPGHTFDPPNRIYPNVNSDIL
ncbi:MAG: carboxypeptidase-like regulatory domain-containing protein, partial [Nitrososphaera sp.]|nr:carboxypeptidase-like regulatory domain-containing protein [Nitrososphaera sp.]